MVAANSAVNAPIKAMIVRVGVTPWVGTSATSSGKMRSTIYTPAETIVAAWIMAETGVGPSIASGSQTCSGHWADLPTVPMKSSSPIAPATEKLERKGHNAGVIVESVGKAIVLLLFSST